MRTSEAIKKIKKLHWERWSDRPVAMFIVSLYRDTTTRQAMHRLGINAEYSAFVFKDSMWYRSEEVRNNLKKGAAEYLKNGGKIRRLIKMCEQEWKNGQARIKAMQREPLANLQNNLAEFAKILNQNNSYVWLTYGLEDAYLERFEKEVRRYIKTDVDKFIESVSVPSYPNAHVALQHALRGSASIQKIQEQFGWIKSRDGFAPGFSLAELTRLRKLEQHAHRPKNPKIFIPPPLRKLVKDIQDIIYFRVLRGDARTNLIFLMRSRLRQTARHYGIKFADLKYYSVYDLASGHLVNHPISETAIAYRGQLYYSSKDIIKTDKIKAKIITGAVGFRGFARGPVKIVTKLEHCGKVKAGDILVASSTYPSFIIAMRRAAAFVSDEGGIACHAAMIAREMHKPCVIGTKNATQVLKDGELVEVDAINGVVRKIT